VFFYDVIYLKICIVEKEVLNVIIKLLIKNE